MTKIGVLGGTFDPVHLGHLAIARAAEKQFSLGKVLFLPAFIPPHKAARRDLTPAPYRVRMVELAIADEPTFELSELELNRPEVSYTVDTLRELHKLYPEAEVYFIVGSDSLAQIQKWKEPDEIQKLAKILVAPRKGFTVSDDVLGCNVELIAMQEVQISSSEIREQFSRSEAVSTDVLPPAVLDYILETHLYQAQGEPS